MESKFGCYSYDLLADSHTDQILIPSFRPYKDSINNPSTGTSMPLLQLTVNE